MRVSWFLFYVLFATSLFGQASVDSLAVVKQVDSLIQVSNALIEKRDFENALEINAAAERIALEKLGVESAAYGKCCFIRGRISFNKSDYLESEKWYLLSIEIRKKALGKLHRDYALSINNLGMLYETTGDYEKAEPLLLEAKNIRERLFGKTHRDYAQSLNNLAVLYKDMGNYELAEPLYLESKALREKTSASDALGYARSLNNLAVFYLVIGDYEKAEPLFLEAKTIRFQSLGKEHPDYANVVSNLSLLYLKMGRFEKAEPLLLETQSILEKTVGRSNPNFAESLANRAVLYSEMGDYGKTEPLLLEAQAIWEKSLGREHPLSSANLSRLGLLYLDLGNFEKAEHLLLEAKMLKEKSLGKLHPGCATSLGNLGILYTKMSEFEKAKQSCLEALTIWEKSFGKMYPDYMAGLHNLASVCEKQGQFAASDSAFSEMTALQQARLSQSIAFLSERELADYTATFQRSGLFLMNCLLVRPQNLVGNLPILAFDNALFQKGFLLSAAVQQNIRADATPELAAINQRLKGFRRRLAAEYAKPIAERKNIAELENATNTAEKELARTVIGYADASRQVHWKEVQSALKSSEAAIEFVHFYVGFSKETDSTMYAALLLLPGNAQPTFVPLFEEKQLETLLKTSGARKSDYVNGIYTIQKTTKKPLYELVWQPLEKDLAGIQTIYFSPSGLLHRLNLNAIPINDKETLSDRYHLVEMGSTRQLVISSEPNRSTPDAGQALLLGGVQYDLNSDSTASQSIDLESNITGTRGDLNFSYTDSTDRGGSWNYLKWTDKEVTALEPILKSAQVQPTVLKGYAATEEAFKSIGSNGKSPRILHIATHGYFFPDPKETTKGSVNGLGAEPVFKLSDHPMIRSGLILAGGNQAWKTGKPFKPGMEDGILTAYEISQMDLSNTELVVLSACETGLGDIQGNEGVYGLQRAFKIAGAKYLIMSLWQVPDFQTQELMTTFYKNWLPSAAEAKAGKTEKMPIPDAFRAAQQAMREKYEHPYFWAGFVLVE